MVAKLLETPAEQAVEHARAHVASLSTEELLALSRVAMTEVAERTRATASNARDPRGEYEHLVRETQAVLNASQSARTLAIARYASVDDHPDQAGELTQRPLGHQAEFADADIAPMLRMTSRTASWVTRDACTAVVVAPRLLRLAGTGAVSMYLVDKITELLEHTAPHIRARIEQRLLDARIEEATTVRALGWVRRWLLTLDPDALSDKATKERKERVDVRWWGGDLPGLTEFIATLPAGHAAQIITAVDTLAKQLHADPPNAGKTMGECRADALLQLVMANVTCHIQLTLLGHATSPPGCTQCDSAGQQRRPQHDTTGGAAPNDEPQWHTHDHPEHSTPAGHASERHPACFPGEDCAHREVDLDHIVDDFDLAAYLDDWCARASIPGSLEQAVAEIDRQESLDQETANAHQYDDEAFEAWFAPIADAAAELEFAPFGTTDGDHEELPASSGAAEPRRRGLQHRVGFIPPDQLDSVLSGRRATLRHAVLRPDGLGAHRLGGISTANRSTLTATTIEALTTFIADRSTQLDVTADTRSPAYRVPAHIRRFVELRDEHCRYPGCSRSAKYCEADHVIPWGTPGGHTTPSNLQLLCKRHHRVKTAKRWSVTMTRDGDCTWTSPTGSVHITRPSLTLS